MGPRQVGKTTLAFNIADSIPSIYLDLENRTDLQKVQDIEAFHTANADKLIILDEVQRLPEIFAPIRGIIDAQRRKGNKHSHFLFLGSAAIDLLQQSSESLAGRISYIELFPVDAMEFLKDDNDIDALNNLWVRGGFPESLLAQSEEDSLQWRKDFIKTYLERDIPMLGPRIPSETLERFWVMLAHTQGSLLNASKLATSLEVSSVTIARYIDLFVDLLLVRRLQPFTANVKKRLVKSPKIYVRDAGMTHALLNIQNYNDLLGHPAVGGSWEGFVIENICAHLPSGADVFYYRTAGGAEIDLIIQFSPNEKWAIEIKRSAASSSSKGFYEGCEDISADRKFLIHGQSDVFQLKDNIEVVSLYSFLKQLNKA